MSTQSASKVSGKARLSIKQLESYLQDLDEFEKPKIALEQYATPPHIAALILNTIDLTYNDLDGKIVADLGCGTGRLSVGSVICGAQLVIGIDIDRDALGCGLNNVIEIFGDDNADNEQQKLGRACEKINFVQADIAASEDDQIWHSLRKKFDTVVMNPPFGTKHNAGLDVVFLKRAIEMADGVVYSLHKTSTRDYIMSKCKQWAVQAKPVAQIKYNLDNTYKFHKKKSVDIDVDLWRITCPNPIDPLLEL